MLSAFDLEGRCLTACGVHQVKHSGGSIHDHELSAVKTSDETVGVGITLHNLEARQHVDHLDHRGRGKASAFPKYELVQVGTERVRDIHARAGDQDIVEDNAIAELNLVYDVAAGGVIDDEALFSEPVGA